MGQKKIVIVDDDSLLSKMIDICLRQRGHEVKVCHSGVDAVKYLFGDKPDSMVLDIRLPDCDGWFIARLLEQLEGMSNVPVIVLSVIDPDRREVAQLKPYAYIQKPFDMGHLMETVERSLSEDRPLVAS